MGLTDLEKLHELETQIAATAEDQRAPLLDALERLVKQMQAKGMTPPVDLDSRDDDAFDNMPV